MMSSIISKIHQDKNTVNMLMVGMENSITNYETQL